MFEEGFTTSKESDYGDSLESTLYDYIQSPPPQGKPMTPPLHNDIVVNMNTSDVSNSCNDFWSDTTLSSESVFVPPSSSWVIDWLGALRTEA